MAGGMHKRGMRDAIADLSARIPHPHGMHLSGMRDVGMHLSAPGRTLAILILVAVVFGVFALGVALANVPAPRLCSYTKASLIKQLMLTNPALLKRASQTN